MRLIGLAVFLTVSLILAPLAAEAQQAGKAYRIGTLTVSPADRAAHFIVAFEERLKELGYVKGSNITYEHRFAGGRTERLPEIARELAALNVDVIIAGNNASIAAAKQATSKISIVMTYGVDPVRVGFIDSLAHPGGNITGLTADVRTIRGQTLGTPERGRSPSITRGCRLESTVPGTSVRLESARDRCDCTRHADAINRGPTT
jgi:ABC-type uncharacterized transport system substrate-binding protein